MNPLFEINIFKIGGSFIVCDCILLVFFLVVNHEVFLTPEEVSGGLVLETDKSEITGEYGLGLLKEQLTLYLILFLDKLLTDDLQRWKEKVLRGS